jgi:hypothetical protein
MKIHRTLPLAAAAALLALAAAAPARAQSKTPVKTLEATPAAATPAPATPPPAAASPQPGAPEARPPEPTAIVTKESGSASAEDAKRLLQRYAAEPTIREIQEAAMRYAEVHPELIASWRTRVRAQAWAPELRGEYRFKGNNDLRDRVGGGSVDSPATPLQQNDLKNENRGLGRLTWNLNELVFNREELRVSSEATDLVRLREDVLDQATKLYFERRRLQIDLDLEPPRDLAGRVRKELRMQELTADLDALTGGFLSSRLKDIGRDPY